MTSRVVWENRHKFIYYDYESIKLIKKLSSEYPPKLNSEEPIAIHIIDESLPMPKEDNQLLNKDIIISFHNRYYELTIFQSIIEELIKNIDNEQLNEKLIYLFKEISYSKNTKIKDIKTLQTLLIESKNIYKETYIEYITTGTYNDFYDKIPIPYIMIDMIIPSLKKQIGLKKYFSIILEFENKPTKYSSMTINNYIASRCNGYLSMNILLSDDNEWRSYYSTNRQLIEWCHDYTEMDFREKKECKKLKK